MCFSCHNAEPAGSALIGPQTIVDRFELAAVDGDARLRQKAYLSANGDELCAHLAYRKPVILAEIGNRLVIRNQPTGEPHHLNVAASLTLKPATRLNPVIQLQQITRRVAGTARRLNADESDGIPRRR